MCRTYPLLRKAVEMVVVVEVVVVVATATATGSLVLIPVEN